MKLTLAISPCPNDTFMFDALINGRIDTRGLEFDVRFSDIEELNGRVMSPDGPDISKISYAVLPEIVERYALLDSGSALGFGNGPIFVIRDGVVIDPKMKIAIPGIHTTANMLLQRLYPELTDRQPVLFSEIAPAVARGEFDGGVLIHEGRFTFREYGLELAADLGEKWSRATYGLPLPLGAIVVRRSLSEDIRRGVEEILYESILYAMANPKASREFVGRHAQELSHEVIDSHIALFVNENSLTLDLRARQAIQELTGISPE